MEEFKACKTHESRMQFIKQMKQAPAGFYQFINTQEDAFELIQLLIEKDRNIDIESIIDSVKELDLMGLYCQYASVRYQTNVKVFEKIGKVTQKLIEDFRKKGNIVQKFYLETKEIQKQHAVVNLVVKLGPKYLEFNPELFTIMLQYFECLVSGQEINRILIEDLSETLISWCKSEKNLNADHDWLALISGIFEQAYLNHCGGMFVILQRITIQVLTSLLMKNQQYLLMNYFNSAENTVRIFTGLTSKFIISENIVILRQVSEMIVQRLETTHSKKDLEILTRVYNEYILVVMIGNVQMITCGQDILELITFYTAGLSIKEIPAKSIELLCKRLQLILNLKFSSKNFITPIVHFLNNLLNLVPNLKQNAQLMSLVQFAKDSQRSSSYDQVFDRFKPWNTRAQDFKQDEFAFLQKADDEYVGLENLTNTCFMNSFIQSMFMNKYFRQYILRLKQTPEFESIQFEQKQQMIICLTKLFMLLTYQKSGYCSPYQLKRQLREPYSNTNEQQDVSEFGHHLLEDLQALLPKQEAETLRRMFFGQQQSILSCEKCKKNHKGNQENFLGIDLHFSMSGQENDLKSMMRTAFEKELLDFRCEACNNKSDGNSKQIQLISLPPFMMVTLHRFTYDPQAQNMTKILDKLPIEFNLDLHEIYDVPKSDSSNYTLYAFIVHLGQTANSGHYTTYARQLDKDPHMWMDFDDTYIRSSEIANYSQFDEKLADQETPYILFYQNKSLQPLHFQ